MKRTAFVLAIALVLVSCATMEPRGQALVTQKKAGISPARFAGGHGSVADYAPLAALEGR